MGSRQKDRWDSNEGLFATVTLVMAAGVLEGGAALPRSRSRRFSVKGCDALEAGTRISSIELENIALSHPAFAGVACVAVPHPKWGERPLLVVVRKSGHTVSREELLAHLAGKVARWQVPDDVVFVEAIPLGPTGKMLKGQLRERFRDHRWPRP